MALDVVVLVSLGRHPLSNRARRAPADAQALEIGLTLAADHGANLLVLHAGDPRAPALRDYLGMGVDALHVLSLSAGADPVPALVARLRALAPGLVLTGMQSETGDSSGYVPYAVAAGLDYAIAPATARLVLDGAAVQVQQALPRGRRRALHVSLPAVVAVHQAAPPARQVAYAPARRGRLIVEPAGSCPARPSEPVEVRPARVRPRRLAGAKGATAVERLRALTASTEQSARIVHPSTPAEGAREIVAFLRARSLQEGDKKTRKPT